MGEVYSITRDIDLKNIGAWISSNTAAVAMNKAAEMYGKGQLQKPVVYVDGRKNRDPKDVKPFGNIIFVPGVGPIREAAQLAWSIVQSAEPRRTGHYASSWMWYVNGMPRGPNLPDLAKLGRGSNVQLANLAPYAAAAEIQVPRGVLYAAYNAIRRAFKQRVAVKFNYRPPAAEFTPNAGGGYKTPTRPWVVPVLTIGSPSSKVKTFAKRPGVMARRRRQPKRKPGRKGGK